MTMKSYMKKMKGLLEETNKKIAFIQASNPCIDSPDYKYLQILKIRLEIYKEDIDYWLSKSVYLDSDEKLLHNPLFK